MTTILILSAIIGAEIGLLIGQTMKLKELKKELAKYDERN